jgi:hypothetical protein
MLCRFVKMPFIREYSEDEEEGGKEAELVMPPRESPMHNALHETLHVVIARLDGLDISDVVDQDDAAWTRLIEPQRFTVEAMMAPEVYMSLNNVAFTDDSVSIDRNAIAECYRPEAVENIRQDSREWLEVVFRCPYVRAAISILTVRMDDELRDHKIMKGSSIHEIIDPILQDSPYADGLRDKLNG